MNKLEFYRELYDLIDEAKSKTNSFQGFIITLKNILNEKLQEPEENNKVLNFIKNKVESKPKINESDYRIDKKVCIYRGDDCLEGIIVDIIPPNTNYDISNYFVLGDRSNKSYYERLMILTNNNQKIIVQNDESIKILYQ